MKHHMVGILQWNISQILLIHVEIPLLMTCPTMTLMSVKIWNSRVLKLNGHTDDVN